MLQSRAHGRKRGARTPKEEAGAAGGEAAAEATGEFHLSFLLAELHFYINTISGVIVGAEVVVIGVPTGVGEKEGGEADSGKLQMSLFRYY